MDDEVAVEAANKLPDATEKTAPLQVTDTEDIEQVQPSIHPNDPLNWPYWIRVYISLLVSGLGFWAQAGSALIVPAFVVMSEDLHVSVEQASYCTTVYILLAGIFPMFVVPLSNVYGRRPVYVIFTAIAVASQFGSGAASSYGGVIVGRVFYGIGAGIPLGIGAATICDIFPHAERGLYLGIYALCLNNGPHLAPIIGGYIALNLHWRWCFYVPGIIQGGLLVLILFTMPDTLFCSTESSGLESSSYKVNFKFKGKILKRRITFNDFVRPYRMIGYWAVSLPAIFWMTANSYGSLLFAVTGSYLARKLYDFDVGQTGLFLGVPLSIGCMIGEASAGWVSDRIVRAHEKRHAGQHKPEVRLLLLPGTLAVTAGMIAYGICVQNEEPWIVLAVCLGVASVGLQMGGTMTYTYTTDCYKPQASEIGAVINLFKSVLAFSVGFYGVPFGEHAGWDVSFPVLAMINGLTMLPLVLLWFKGEQIRAHQGTPDVHQDFR